MKHFVFVLVTVCLVACGTIYPFSLGFSSDNFCIKVYLYSFFTIINNLSVCPPCSYLMNIGNRHQTCFLYHLLPYLLCKEKAEASLSCPALSSLRLKLSNSPFFNIPLRLGQGTGDIGNLILQAAFGSDIAIRRWAFREFQFGALHVPVGNRVEQMRDHVDPGTLLVLGLRQSPLLWSRS